MHRPSNIIGALQSSVELLCTSDLMDRSINWEYKTIHYDDDNSWKWIYLSSIMTTSLKHMFRVANYNGNSSLLINALDWKHAGIYRCTDDSGLGESATAELTVLDSIPQCKTYSSLSNGSTPETPRIASYKTCRLYYAGGMILSLENLTDHIDYMAPDNISSVQRYTSKIKALSFTVVNRCEERVQTVQSSNGVSNESCIGFNVVFAVPVSAAALMFVMLCVLCSYTVHLKRHRTRLNSLPKASKSTYVGLEKKSNEKTYRSYGLQQSNYDEIEVDDDGTTKTNNDYLNATTDTTVYSDMQAREPVQPQLYDRLTRPRTAKP